MFEFLRSNTGKVINVNDIDGILGKIELIDIREPYEYNAGSIKGAKNIKTIPYSFFKNGVKMDEITSLFYSHWEANKFQSDAVNKQLLEFRSDGKFYQVDSKPNEIVKSISVDSKTGSIMKINLK